MIEKNIKSIISSSILNYFKDEFLSISLSN